MPKLMPKTRFLSVMSILALAGLGIGRAEAASQVLGLVASNGLPTPLHCEDGVCSGHFSSFCLQEARPAPATDSEYQLAPGAKLTLIAGLPDGRSLRLPGNGLLAVHALIGFTSVRIDLPEDELKALGAVSVAVEVAPDSSILPAPVAGDPNPQSPEELAYATGPMRRLAELPFERPGPGADAARLTSLAINSLPADEPQTPEGRKALLDQVVAAATAVPLSAEGVAQARRIYRSCEIAVDSRSSFNLRTCLEIQHADLMASTNRGFWRSNGGS
jgi:hypothetical protein